MANIVARTKGS